MPREIITANFGETASDKLNPYTLFASIDSNNPQQVVQWFTNFGAPDGNVRFDTQEGCYYPLDVFAKHVREMNNVCLLLSKPYSPARKTLMKSWLILLNNIMGIYQGLSVAIRK